MSTFIDLVQKNPDDYIFMDFVQNAKDILVERFILELKNHHPTVKKLFKNNIFYHWYNTVYQETQTFIDNLHKANYPEYEELADIDIKNEEESFELDLREREGQIIFPRFARTILAELSYFTVRHFQSNIFHIYLLIAYSPCSFIIVDQSLAHLGIIQFEDLLTFFTNHNLSISVPIIQTLDEIKPIAIDLHLCKIDDINKLSNADFFIFSDKIGLLNYRSDSAKFVEFTKKINDLRLQLVKWIYRLRIRKFNIDLESITRSSDIELYKYCQGFEIVPLEMSFDEFLTQKKSLIPRLKYILEFY